MARPIAPIVPTDPLLIVDGRTPVVLHSPCCATRTRGLARWPLRRPRARGNDRPASRRFTARSPAAVSIRQLHAGDPAARGLAAPRTTRQQTHLAARQCPRLPAVLVAQQVVWRAAGIRPPPETLYDHARGGGTAISSPVRSVDRPRRRHAPRARQRESAAIAAGRVRFALPPMFLPAARPWAVAASCAGRTPLFRRWRVRASVRGHR